MKKLLFLTALIILLTGCGNVENEEKKVDTSECLNNAYSEVENYFYNNNENFVFYGLGEEKIIIGLVDLNDESVENLKLELNNYLSCIEIIESDPASVHVSGN